MLERLIVLAVNRRITTLVITVAFLLFGVHTLTRLKVEAFPDVTNVQVMVITLFPGQAAEEVEKQVTIPVERALVGVPNALVQRSITSFGLSQVIVTFEDGVDIYFARQQVSEKLPHGGVVRAERRDDSLGHLGVGQLFLDLLAREVDVDAVFEGHDPR